MTSFNCKTCDKKFIRDDYAKPDIISKLTYTPHERICISKLNNRKDITESKWFNHLLLPTDRTINKGAHCKPWEYVCPNSICIICYIEMGDSDNFQSRNAFKYHRKHKCPFRNINYKQYIDKKEYENIKTFDHLDLVQKQPIYIEKEEEIEEVIEEIKEIEEEEVVERFTLEKTPEELENIRLAYLKRSVDYEKQHKKKLEKKAKNHSQILHNLEKITKEHNKSLSCHYN